MTDRDYERWTELRDREATGVPLSALEHEFCKRMIVENPLCAREDAVLAELADLSATPDSGSREREEAVLAAIWNDTPSADLEAAAGASAVRQGSSRGYPKLALVVLAAAIALAVGGGFQALRNTGTSPLADAQASRVELVYTAGNVTVDARAAAFGQLLSEGSVVDASDGAACLAMDPGIDLCLERGSSLRVTRSTGSDRRVDLLHGRVTAAITPQPVGARFSVVADQVWSTAIGTAFSVSRGADKSVDTVVLSGKVLVGTLGKQSPVSAHQRAKVVGDKTTVTAMARAEESPYWASLKTTELWRDPKTAALVVTDEGTHATVWLNGHELGTSPLSSLIPAGEHHLRSVKGDGFSVEQRFSVAAGKTWSMHLKSEAAPETAVEVVAPDAEASAKLAAVDGAARKHAERHGMESQAASQVVAASELLAQARQQLRGKDWRAAATTYRSVRALHPDSTEAATVLVSLAKLSLEHLNDPTAALSDLNSYLASGGGSLTQEARYLRIQALRRLGKNSIATDAARAFLDDYPTSFPAETLRRELATSSPTVEPLPRAE